MDQEPVSFGIASQLGPSKTLHKDAQRPKHLLISIDRAYYARPLSATSKSKDRSDRRPSTSTEDISLHMFRPRTRAKDTVDQRRRDSLAIGRVRPGGLDLTEVSGLPLHRSSPNWSPHLWHNRASPRLDEQAEGGAPSKRTAQILLFAVGFIFPPGD